MKKRNLKESIDVIAMFFEYSDRRRNGWKPDIEEYLTKIPKRQHKQFLKLVSLDALADIVGGSGPRAGGFSE